MPGAPMYDSTQPRRPQRQGGRPAPAWCAPTRPRCWTPPVRGAAEGQPDADARVQAHHHRVVPAACRAEPELGDQTGPQRGVQMQPVRNALGQQPEQRHVVPAPVGGEDGHRAVAVHHARHADADAQHPWLGRRPGRRRPHGGGDPAGHSDRGALAAPQLLVAARQDTQRQVDDLHVHMGLGDVHADQRPTARVDREQAARPAAARVLEAGVDEQAVVQKLAHQRGDGRQAEPGRRRQPGAGDRGLRDGLPDEAVAVRRADVARGAHLTPRCRLCPSGGTIGASSARRTGSAAPSRISIRRAARRNAMAGGGRAVLPALAQHAGPGRRLPHLGTAHEALVQHDVVPLVALRVVPARRLRAHELPPVHPRCATVPPHGERDARPAGSSPRRGTPGRHRTEGVPSPARPVPPRPPAAPRASRTGWWRW